MKRQIIRVEPLASLLEKSFEPDTGEICKGPGTIQRQTELVLEQVKLCLETAPARIFISVPARNGGFDIEIDCIAAV